MFSGIIETTTELVSVSKKGSNKLFSFRNPFPGEIYTDQSISHDGTCLTVIDFDNEQYTVEAVEETLRVTNLDKRIPGDIINLERAVMAQTRMDGHMVQGHIDGTCILEDIKTLDGSWELRLRIPEDKTSFVIPKGSIALNGISLTLKSVEKALIEVAIIPFTYELTNINTWQKGDDINVEYDMLGKYIVAYMQKINAR